MREEVIKTAKIRHLKLQRPLIVPSGARTLEVISSMRKSRQTCVLICRGEQCIGIFTERDFLNKMLTQKADTSLPIDKWMSADPKTLTPDDTLEKAIHMMHEFGYRNIPLVDNHGKCAGLLQIRNITDYLAELYPQEVLNRPPRENQKFSAPDGA
jgi:CBS domain-containing protein